MFDGCRCKWCREVFVRWSPIEICRLTIGVIYITCKANSDAICCVVVLEQPPHIVLSHWEDRGDL